MEFPFLKGIDRFPNRIAKSLLIRRSAANLRKGPSSLGCRILLPMTSFLRRTPPIALVVGLFAMLLAFAFIAFKNPM